MTESKNFSTKNQTMPQDKPQIISTALEGKMNSALLKERRIVTLQSQSFEADVFKLLRTKILKQLKTNQWNSFGITSPAKGSGKSMVAANLAIAIAMDVNQSVLLVDMDMLHPKIAWYFNLTVEFGLKDYILANKSLSDILISPGINKLEILPDKNRGVNTSEIISNSKMRDLINEIKSNSESKIIIFDLPPVLVADDVLVSMDYFDALLFVIEDGGNSADTIKKSLQMIADKPLLGIVLNKADNLPSYQDYYLY